MCSCFTINSPDTLSYITVEVGFQALQITSIPVPIIVLFLIKFWVNISLLYLRLPLAESRQMYHSMDLSLRKQFYGMMEKISNTHNLLQMTYPSFMLHQGFKTRYQCADYVYSMVATLETNVSLSSFYKLHFDFYIASFCFLILLVS